MTMLISSANVHLARQRNSPPRDCQEADPPGWAFFKVTVQNGITRDLINQCCKQSLLTSNRMYGTKKIIRTIFHCVSVIPKSSSSPSILALPILLRSIYLVGQPKRRRFGRRGLAWSKRTKRGRAKPTWEPNESQLCGIISFYGPHQSFAKTSLLEGIDCHNRRLFPQRQSLLAARRSLGRQLRYYCCSRRV